MAIDHAEIRIISTTRLALKSGRALQELRAAHVGNVDVARALDVRPDQVSRWLCGHKSPNRENTLAIARLLDELAGLPA